MRFIHFIFFAFFSVPFTSAQTGGETEGLLLEAKASVFIDPEQALKISGYVLGSSTDFKQKTEANHLMARAYYVKGNYDQTLKTLLNSKETIEAGNDPETKIKMYSFSAHVFQLLGLSGLAEGYMGKAREIKPKNENSENWFSGKLLQYHAFSHSEKGDFKEALNNLHKARSHYEKTDDGPFFQMDPVDIALAKTYLNNFQLDSADLHLDTALKISRANPPNGYLEMLALSGMGRLYFLRKENRIAIENLLASLKIAEEFGHLPLQKTITENLASNYLALDDKENFFAYNQRIFPLANSIEIQENAAMNTAYNFVNEAQEKNHDTVKDGHLRNIYILSGLLLLIVLSGFIINSRLRLREKQYTDLLKYLEVGIGNNPPKKEIGKSPVTPKETEKTLLAKLNRFENSSRFTAKDMSLAQLAAKFETNTKYLSEVINIHKEKNFNSYINELRIGYIIEKLKNEPAYLNYKISYLADESGFASHSSFATVFKSITGISPTVFMELLGREDKNFINNKAGEK